MSSVYTLHQVVCFCYKQRTDLLRFVKLFDSKPYIHRFFTLCPMAGNPSRGAGGRGRECQLISCKLHLILFLDLGGRSSRLAICLGVQSIQISGSRFMLLHIPAGETYRVCLPPAAWHPLSVFYLALIPFATSCFRLGKIEHDGFAGDILR